MPARLVTIPISHYCEKARWALDRAGIAYIEERHLQLIHVVAARRAGGGRTVPVLRTLSGSVLADSADILRWAGGLYPSPEAAQLEAWLDSDLGPEGRRWMYHHTLPHTRALARWILAGVPRWERAAFRWGVRGVEPAIRHLLDVDAGTAAAALEHVDRVFDAVAARLADGRRFLVDDRFSAADLTFAALAAPVILPAGYGSPLPPLSALPAAMVRDVERLRAHPAGGFATRMYAEERHVRGASRR
jgi:glutathione S-transferase